MHSSRADLVSWHTQQIRLPAELTRLLQDEAVPSGTAAEVVDAGVDASVPMVEASNQMLLAYDKLLVQMV